MLPKPSTIKAGLTTLKENNVTHREIEEMNYLEL
jgi:hypothetical protein